MNGLKFSFAKSTFIHKVRLGRTWGSRGGGGRSGAGGDITNACNNNHCFSDVLSDVVTFLTLK